MSLAKNKGPLLTSLYNGGVNEFPQEFLANVGLVVTAQHVPVDIGLDPITGLLIESKVEQERDNERKKTNTSFSDFPGELDSYVKLPSGLVGFRTRQLVPDPTVLVVDNLTDSADQHNLGNGWLDQTVVEAPSLFGHEQFRRTRPVVTPQDFGALLQTDEVSETQFGTAVDPTLSGGDVEASDEQLDVFTHRTNRSTLDLVSLPASFVNFKTNQYKQIVQETRTLEDDTTTPVVPTALRDVEFTILGDGTALEVVDDIDEVFDQRGFSRDRDIVTPSDFRAKLQTVDLEAVVPGSATEPAPFADGDGLISQSTKQLTEFTYRASSKSIDLVDLPQTNVNKRTNRYKQVETVTRLLEVDTSTPDTPTALKDVNFTKLGDGTAVEERVTIPSVFENHIYTKERPDVTPDVFKALLQITEDEFTEAGTAGIPTLGAGEYRRSQQQVDLFDRRISVRSRDQGSLPITVVDKRTNRFKQVETVTRILEVDSSTPLTPTALLDVNFTKLGDGNAVEERIAIASVFDNKVSSKEVPDLLPEIFKALLPLFTTEVSSAGTITDPPSLATGDLFKSETQTDIFTKRVTTRTRSGISLPQDIVTLRHLGGFEFGGEHTKITGYLDDSEPLVEDGLGVVSSEVRNLGNGTWFRQTEEWDDDVTEWPELSGQETDPRTGVVIDIRKKVVAAGDSLTPAMDEYIDNKPIDKWKTLSIGSKLDVDSLPAPRTWETTIEHAFPNVLNGASWLATWASGTLAYDFDMVLLLDMTQGYAGPCRALVTESFSQGPPGDTVTITQFSPQAHQVGYSWAFAASLTEECDACQDFTRAQARREIIPPSLHDTIDLSGGVTLDHGTFTDTLPATTPIALPTPGTLITKAVEVEPWRFNIFYRKLIEIYVP